MKRFVLTLAVLSATLFLVVVVMHVVAILNLQDDVDAAYTIPSGTEVLAVGSSQLGCSLDYDPKYKMYKLWVSDTISPSFLMRLKELERRNQLDDAKICLVPFNHFSTVAQTRRGCLWAFYQELPVSWRYLDMLPYGKGEFLRYIACNLVRSIPCPLSGFLSPGDWYDCDEPWRI